MVSGCAVPAERTGLGVRKICLVRCRTFLTDSDSDSYERRSCRKTDSSSSIGEDSRSVLGRLRGFAILGMFVVAACGNAETVPDQQFNSDSNGDGFITREEALAAFGRLEENKIAPGLWRIRFSTDRPEGPEPRSMEQEQCLRPGDWESMWRDDLFADRYDEIRQLPDEGTDISEFVIDGTKHRITLTSKDGKSLIEGHFSPESFKNNLAMPDKTITYEGTRLGTCAE